MTPDRIRLSEFAKWNNETSSAIRGLLVRNEVPFPQAMPDGSQRTYDGADLLAWCLFTQLRRTGIATRSAADLVRISTAVRQFLTADARGDDVSDDLHLIAWSYRRDRGEAGIREVQNQTCDTSAVAASIMQQEAQRYGLSNEAGETQLGLVSLVAIPILPCYDRCRATAEAHGFRMIGPDLFEIET